MLLSFSRVGVIRDHTTCEAILQGSCCDHVKLLTRLGVDLESTSSTLNEAAVQILEELRQSFVRVVVLLLSAAQPLYG